MAGMQNTSSTGNKRFDKDLGKDIKDYHLPENVWSHARNAINNSKTGDLGRLGNEPSNKFCAAAPYTVIGVIHLIADKWAVYSTNGTDSEIGVFIEDQCLYETVVNDPCLNFKATNLIKGVSRARSTCNYSLYWDDGLNPSRLLTITIDPVADNAYTNPNSPIPWVQECTDENGIVLPGSPGYEPQGCIDCVNLDQLDCDAIRLAPFIQVPCIEVKKGISGGTLLNGSYQVAVAYAIDGQKVSDWYISNVQPVFQHLNGSNSIDVYLEDIDQDYDEIQVAVISVTNQQTVARLAGVYNTRQKQLSFDTIDNTWPTIPISEVPLMVPVADKSDAIYSVNNYLLRVGPTSKQDFNYQPLANQIVTKWQSVEYPSDYYRKGGNKTNYLRDEVYAFFIRWVYDTGDKSSSYHIPGRPATASELAPVSTDALQDELTGGFNYTWLVQNTATTTLVPPQTLDDGGVVIAEGYMGYWESTEKYPDNTPEIWNANIAVSPYTNGVLGADHDLCGKQIRHHRMPDLETSTLLQYYRENSPNVSNGRALRVLGVKFENIFAPVDNDGDPIPGIVGYEILRGTRNGNKTILAKGLINNMRRYELPNGVDREGAFPNYPYNDLRPDPFLSTTETQWAGTIPFGTAIGGLLGENDYNPLVDYFQDLFTFHSPETNFTDPFLSAKELKVHGEMYGGVVGKFELSEEHPREKLLTNLTFILSAIAGLGIASLAMTPERKTEYVPPINPGYSKAPLQFWVAGGPVGNLVPLPVPFIPGLSGEQPAFGDIPFILPLPAGITAASQAYDTATDPFTTVLAQLAGINIQNEGVGPLNTLNALLTAYSTAGTPTSVRDGQSILSLGETQYTRTPRLLRTLTAIPTFFNYFTQGTDSVLDFFKAVVPYRDFALRYHSHCFYDNFVPPTSGNKRRSIVESQYIGPQITDFGTNTRINNLYRAKTVAVQLDDDLTNPTVDDVTRIRVTEVDDLKESSFISSTPVIKEPDKQEFGPNSNYSPNLLPGNNGIQVASSHYVSLKQRIRNQYGQINGIQQFPISCVFEAPRDPNIPTSTGEYTPEKQTVFGGDTYLGRYTEKNTFFFFYNWLYDQPDGAQFDYTKNYMLPYPRYWANFEQFETGDFMGSLSTIITNFGTILNPNQNATGVFSDVITPNDYYNLDGLENTNVNLGSLLFNFRFAIKFAYFYLFNSGVKDFWVESEINVDLRDWGELETELHYDPYRYTDRKALFNTNIIKAGNYYKYDFSLSLAKLWNQYISWGNVQPGSYDPYLAETCFVYLPKRIIYSLPAQFEGLRDNWRLFLANNYKDFLSRVTSVKSVSKSGAMIFFENESPLMFQGLDQLQTTGGTKLTIGDGGLFTQPLQNIINTERPYEYGSCQDRLSAINTPAGIFWMSQNQGKIFNYQGSINEISLQSLKWWFANFLPYKLTEEFPDFELIDNPVIGIGCQSIYDNENGLVYFTKRDFIIKPDLPLGTTLEYESEDNFTVMIAGVSQFSIKLGDPRYFEDASWTISYDPKIKGWISFHDWHPNLLIPGKNTFMSVLDDGIWIHNERCDSYCNFYGQDYPFEVEFIINTVQYINSLRSIEYRMEAYKYDDNCHDRFHVLDYNFDEAVIYNTEQCSGLLRLNLEPKNDPQAILDYPIIGFNFIEILFSKEENRYRFNQFWDITDDRGEFNSSAERVIWNTQANGYIKVLNENNLNYNKSQFERKKFRHYTSTVLLRKNVSGNRKILVVFANIKNLLSPR